MLKDIGVLAKNAWVFVMYINDSYLTYYIRNKINKGVGVVSSYIVEINNKNIKKVNIDSKVRPLLCDKWVLYGSNKTMSGKEIIEDIQNVSGHALKVYFIDDYGVYKKVVNSEAIKSLGVYAKSFYFGQLNEKDIDYLYQDLVVSRGYIIEKDILKVLKKDYSRSISSIFKVFQEIVSGNELKTKEDLIDLVGLGDVNVVNFFIKSYLKIVENKDAKKAVNKVIKEMSHISKVMDFRSIKSMIKWAIEGFIEIKILQIMGIYDKAFIQLPEGVNKKRVERVKIYDWFVLDRVSLHELLCLYEDIKQMVSYNDEIELMKFFYGLEKYRK